MDVPLKEGEQALHGGFVAVGAEPSHRADHAMPAKGADVLPALRMRPVVGMYEAAGNVTSTAVGPPSSRQRGDTPKVDLRVGRTSSGAGTNPGEPGHPAASRPGPRRGRR